MTGQNKEVVLDWYLGMVGIVPIFCFIGSISILSATKAQRSHSTRSRSIVALHPMMISSTAPSNEDGNNIVGSTTLSVVQTVKKWIQSSWPLFGGSKIDENERNAASEEEATTTNEKANAAVVYLHQDESASVDEHTEEANRGGNNDGEERRDGAVLANSSNEASSALSSNENEKRNNNDDKPGSKVMDLVMAAASPKKYFLRNRRRKSCRFQLDNVKTTDVASSSSNNHGGIVMASSHFVSDNISSKEASSNKHDDGKSNQGKLHPNAAPTLPQDTTTTTHNHWTQKEINSLRKAYQQSNPTSTTLWHDIATIMGGERSASECQRKWFSLVATPRKRVVAGRSRRNGGGRMNAASQVKNEDEDCNEDDDIFDSTPLKHAVQEIENDVLFQQRLCTTTAATVKQQPLEQDYGAVFHSPNKMMTKTIKSPLPKRPRMFSPKHKKNSNNSNGGKNDTVLSPLLNRRKGYNTYVNNLRREMNRAQKKKGSGGDEKMSNGDGNYVGSCSNNSGNINKGSSRNGIVNKSSNSIRIKVKEGKGKSQLSAELVDGTFVLNFPQEDGNEDHDSDVDVFEEVFRMEDEENEFP